MADITTLFKATIKTLKAREKKFNSTSADKQIDKSILKRNRKSEFAISAKNVVGLITKLKEFLLENRKDYLNDAGLLGIGQSTMTNLERDQMDNEAESFMKKCKDAINQLRVQAGYQKATRQARENKGSILELLEKYLVAVCKLYSQQRAIRMKRDIDRKRISRLQPDPILSLSKSLDNVRDEGGDGGTKENQKTQDRLATNLINDSHKHHKIILNEEKSEDFKGALEHPQTMNELSEEDTLMLLTENEQLFESMSTMVDEVRVIEGKVVEISQLQELFTEKVLEQDVDVDRLAGAVVGSSENIREANDEIREAMKNNAGFRLWILFFLLVCTFSLLFLDWYNA